MSGLEDRPDDVFHVPDHAGNQEKEKHEYHESDRETYLHPVSLLVSHHENKVAGAELTYEQLTPQLAPKGRSIRKGRAGIHDCFMTPSWSGQALAGLLPGPFTLSREL